MTRNKNSLDKLKKENVKKNIPAPTSDSKTPSLLSNFTSSILQGFSFGTGSAIAHNTIDQVVNKKSNIDKDPPISSSESIETKEFQNIDCDRILDLYINCNYDKPSSSDDECKKILKLYNKCIKYNKSI